MFPLKNNQGLVKVIRVKDTGIRWVYVTLEIYLCTVD